MKIQRSLTALILSFGLLFAVMSLLSGSPVSIVQAAPSVRPALAPSSPIGETPLLTLTGEATGNYFGFSVASVDDVNGDGFADVLVGASAYNNWQGRAYLYLGSPTGLSTTPTLTLTGEATHNSFGSSVASAGDVNSDGYADALVGAYEYNGVRGRAYLYLGGPIGLGTTPALTLTGEAAGNYFGVSVASAGDVNGDGYDDALVGAYGYNSLQGRAYLYLGSPSGLSATPALTLTGEAANDVFGQSVASAGDVNGDGFAEVIVGAYGSNSFQGRAYLYLGSPTGLSSTPTFTLAEASSDGFGQSVASAGDVNGDGFADVLVGADMHNDYQGRTYLYLGNTTGLTPTPALTLTGETTYNEFGYSVATAGDMNGDGYADALIGAYYYSGLQGRAYLYLGSPTGLSATPILTLTGEATNNYYGHSVASAGDVNGDGYAEVIVGAYGANSAQGRAYLYGHIPSLAPRPTGVTPSINAVGVPLTNNISIAFDEPIDLTSVTTGTFVVHGSQSPIFTGTYSLSDLSRTITLNPARTFFPGEVVHAVATTGTLNITGTHMLTPTQWQFTAGPIAPRCVGGFTQDTGAALTGVYMGSLAWGDYDNDGHLDILLVGYIVGPGVAQVWHNNGNGTFTQIPTSLPGVFVSSVAWGDYDNDGYLDILLAGDTGSGYVTQVWHNNGDGMFTQIPTSLPGVREIVAWGDYDNDGYLDILLAGRAVWHNNGNGTFTQIPTSLPGVYMSSAAWGDYDNDGYLDILLAGQTGSAAVTQVWHNNGNGTFTQIPTSLPGVYMGSAAWGDYDNDGYLDILLTGYTGSAAVTQVWHNNGNGTFTQIPTSLPSVYTSSAAWGDYDNDGHLDILLAGYRPFSGVTQVWHSDDCVADLTITMTASPEPAIAGTSLFYTITVANQGGIKATNVVVSDTLPPSTTLTMVDPPHPNIMASQGNCAAPAPDRFSCALGNVAVGGLVTITAEVFIDPSALGIITNTAFVTATAPITNPLDDATFVTTTVFARSDLSIVKYNDGDLNVVNPSSVITYHLDVYNAGPSTALTPTITDTLPARMTGSAWGNGWTCLSGNTITCTRPSLNVYQWSSINVTATAPMTQGWITNTAWISSPVTPDPDLANNHDTQSTLVIPLADLVIEKTANPDPVNPGATLTYTIIVTNSGPYTATGVIVTDTLPTAFTSYPIGGAGWSCGAPGNVVICSLLTPLTPTFSTRFNITLTAPLSGFLMNTAQVSSAIFDPEPDNNFVVAYAAVRRVADLSIVKRDYLDPVDANAALTYTLSITNAGPVPAGVLTNTLTFNQSRRIDIPRSGRAEPYPSSLYLTSIDGVVQNITLTLNNFSHTYPGDVSALLVGPNGQTAMLMSNAIGGIDVNNVTLRFNDAGVHLPLSGTVTSATIYQPTSYGLTGDLADPAPPGPYGSNLSAFRGSSPNGLWQLYVYDNVDSDGGLIANGWSLQLTTVTTDTVNVTDMLPNGVNFINATGVGWLCNYAGGQVGCEVDSLPIGRAPDITLVITAPLNGGTPLVGGIITNTASITSTTADFGPSNNASTITTTVLSVVDLSIAKTASSNPMPTSTVLTYTLTISNAGPSTNVPVTVTDVLPISATYLRYVAPGWTCTVASNIVTCAAPGMALGPQTIQIAVTTPALAGVIANTASITSTVRDLNPLNNTASITTTIADIPIAGLVATNDSPTVIGHPTTFQATITAGSNVTYVWSFGDGTASINGNPVAHTYAMTGTYTAVVTATNSASVVTATTQATVIPLYKMYLPMVMKD